MGSLAQKLTVLGKTLFSVQLALFSAKCPKLRIFHTTGSCSGDNSEPESINRNYIYLTSGLWEYMARFSRTIGNRTSQLIQVANRKVVVVIFTKEQKSELRYVSHGTLLRSLIYNRKTNHQCRCLNPTYGLRPGREKW